MTARRHRILFLNHVSGVSGAERSLLDLLRHLDRTRFEPMVGAPPAGELEALLEPAGIPLLPLRLRRLRKTYNPLRCAADLLNIVQVTAALIRVIRRERIALVHSNSTTAHLYGGLAARWCGVPGLWHNRDLVRLGPLGRWLGRFATCTIAISDCVRQQTQSWIGTGRELKTIYNGVDADVFVCRGERTRIRESLGIPSGAPVLAMIGQQVPWKRHRTFIEMAAVLTRTRPDARFLIVGDDRFGDHPAYRAGLETQISRLGLGGKVLFTGYRADIAPLLEGIDALIHPALREPLGRVILEAMAMGRPVVAVNACGPGEIIRDGVDGLLVPRGEPDELAAAALRLCREPGLANRLGEAARRRIRDDFDIRRSIRQIEEVYDALLRRKEEPCA